MRELPANHGADLRDLLDRPEAVQASHQEVMKRRRDRQPRQGAGKLPAVARVREQARFQHGLGQLLDEQRHAVGRATICSTISAGSGLSPVTRATSALPGAGRGGSWSAS